MFAVRVGVDARRTARLLGWAYAVDDELAARLVEARGPQFVGAVRRGGAAARSSGPGSTRRATTRVPWCGSSTGATCPCPTDVEYLKDWSVYALGALTGEGELFPHRPRLVRAGGDRAAPGGARACGRRGRGARHRSVRVRRAGRGRSRVAGARRGRGPGARRARRRPAARRPQGVDAGADRSAGADRRRARRARRRPGHRPRPRRGAGDRAPRTTPGRRGARRPPRRRPHRRPAGPDQEGAAPAAHGGRGPAATGAGRRRRRRAARHPAHGERGPCARPCRRGAGRTRGAWHPRRSSDEPAPTGLWRATPPVWDVPRFDVGPVSGAALTEAAARLTGRPDGGRRRRGRALPRAGERRRRAGPRGGPDRARRGAARPGSAACAACPRGSRASGRRCWTGRPTPALASAVVRRPAEAREAAVAAAAGRGPGAAVDADLGRPADRPRRPRRTARRVRLPPAPSPARPTCTWRAPAPTSRS